MHKTFVIEKLIGEAWNQKSRITQAPSRVIGDFDRYGGINPTRGWHVSDTGWRTMMYDWTGVSGLSDTNAPSDLVLSYSQSGLIQQVDASSYNSAAGTSVWWPGAGFGKVPPSNIAFYVDRSGTPTYLNFPSISIGAFGTSTSSGQFVGDESVFVQLYYFVPSAHGYIPIARASAHAYLNLGSYNSVRIAHTPPSGYPLGTIMRVYVAIYDGDEVIVEWDRIFDGAPEEWPGEIYMYDPAAYRSNSSPVVFGTKLPGTDLPDDGYPGHTTFAAERSWHTRKSIVAEAYKIVSAAGMIVPLVFYPPDFYGHTDQYVYFSDPGFIGFSDTFNVHSMNFLQFDDRILSITPSIRGIYAFSEVGTWEAYGSFSSASDTRVSLMPVLGGVDDDRYHVTFSGDTAYFVKEGIIHQIGAGGVKQIGKPIHLMSKPPSQVYYDRFARRLYALFAGSDTSKGLIAIYDPSADAWHEWPELDMHSTSVLTVLSSNKVTAFGNYLSDAGATLPDITIEFEKIDMGLPDVRKRIHSIRIPYDGTYDNVEVRIGNGVDPMVSCNVNDRGGYWDVRCPSVVSRSFDILIKVATQDKDFAVNPPLVFSFRPYGRKYEQV